MATLSYTGTMNVTRGFPAAVVTLPFSRSENSVPVQVCPVFYGGRSPSSRL